MTSLESIDKPLPLKDFKATDKPYPLKRIDKPYPLKKFRAWVRYAAGYRFQLYAVFCCPESISRHFLFLGYSC